MIILGVIAAIFLKTGYDSYRIASDKARPKQDVYLTDVLDAISKKTTDNAVILSYWGDGWPIQTYCRRATNTDGLFESPEIVKRIIEISRIYYDTDVDKLLNFCKKYKITHILFPINHKFDFSTYAGVPYYNYFQEGKPTALGSLTVLYRLMADPKGLTTVEPVYKNDHYILYRLVSR